MHISVETKTALLKGICHSGNIRKAHELFDSMCQSKAKTNYPNVRTLNTLLRGCLWCAVTTSKEDIIFGGVVTAEKAWKKYKSLNDGEESQNTQALDVSSFEYSISLLCQALRVNDAIRRISEMKAAFGLSEEKRETTSSDDQSLTEGLAVAYCALARAYTIMSMEQEAIKACQTSMSFAKESKDALKRGNSFSRKRGWKEAQSREDDRRTESNAIYRNHRLTEIEAEAKTLMNICQEANTSGIDGKVLSRGLARRLITRLIFLSGGGTTGMRHNAAEEASQAGGGKVDVSKEYQRNLLNSLYFSYGLSATTKGLGISMDEMLQILKKKDCNRLLGSVGLQGGILKTDGRLDLHRIFAAGVGSSKPQKKRKSKSRRVEVELGAGFGDWIVRKAIQDPATDFIAVELRADRVAQIFARTAVLCTVKPVDNLCVVGADSGNLLCNHLSEESVDTIYVNHPEPPTQTFGAENSNLTTVIEGGQEPAHMLSSNVIIAIGKALKRNVKSKFVVVTDNFWYGRLICATIERAMRQNPGLFCAVDLTEFGSEQSFAKVETDTDVSEGTVLMFQGKPNETIGYPSGSTEGESYFDRLWRAGAGRHAETHTRYIIVMRSVAKKKNG
jgi:pentatricopeptide repeat protein